jgi:hypothetical protein
MPGHEETTMTIHLAAAFGLAATGPAHAEGLKPLQGQVIDLASPLLKPRGVKP